jgi:hypothetical protein
MVKRKMSRIVVFINCELSCVRFEVLTVMTIQITTL